MSNVYEICPHFENERFLLRFVDPADRDDLLRVYSDGFALPFFNSDNCHGDDFHYTTPERMTRAINMWLDSYARRDFVRWTIVDKATCEAVGTIELFNRSSDDTFNNCGILRLDLRSDYENVHAIVDILSLIVPPAYDLFGCDRIATKAIAQAVERICALEAAGFTASCERLIGHDGTRYGAYFVRSR